MESNSEALTAPVVGTLRRGLLVGGLAALGVTFLAWFWGSERFHSAYLLGWLFWIGVAAGCLPLLFLQHMTGGAWGLAIRRILEAGGRTLPIMALLFLPVLAGLDDLYVWARPDVVAKDPILQYKAAYLNVPFFIVRSVFYFAAWIGLAVCLSRWSIQQDETGDPQLSRRLEIFSGPGLVLYGLVVTFASIDWVMSLDPHWFSHIFGALWGIGQILGAFTMAIAALVLLADQPPLRDRLDPSVFHDLGKLLLAFVMVWAYFSFSQFLIIWSGNTLEEIPWYLHRLAGGWQWIGLALIVGHFVLPFLLLLSRDLKRDTRRLAIVAIFVFLMRFVDIFYFVGPIFEGHHLGIHWLDVLVFLGLGGVWLGLFIGHLQRHPLLPLNDPYLEETFEHAGH